MHGPSVGWQEVLHGAVAEMPSGWCAQVGMQNSALGAVLASLHFADPLTPVPCAISACCHSLIGSALATFFRSRDPRDSQLAAVS